MKLKIWDWASGIKHEDLGIISIRDVPVAYIVDWGKIEVVFGYN